MSQKNLKYDYYFHYPVNDIYQVVLNEQLKFFQSYDSHIKSLTKGISIKKEMYTKTSKKPVKVKMYVQELIENEKIEVVTSYHSGDIVTTYEFKKQDEGTYLSYFEDNHFVKGSHELNFNIMSFFYQWIYKRNMKKRMQYIESQVENGVE